MGLWRIYPTTHYCTAIYGTGTGTHTAAGVWTQPAGDCSAACNESVDALDESLYGWIRSHITNYDAGRFEHTYGAAPSGITITNLRIVAWLRASSGNNAAIIENPRLKGFVNPAGTRYYQTAPTYFIMTQVWVNRQTQGPTGTYAQFTAGEWATNPATGVAWTLSDLAAGTFKAGIECGGVAEGQAGNGLPPTPGANAASLDVALVCIELEGSPSELVTDPVREMLSIELWLRRQRLRRVRNTLTLPHADVALGDVAHIDDPRFPTGEGLGISRREWDARPLFVISRSLRGGSNAIDITSWDMRELAVALWSPLHTDLGADDTWSGIAWIHRGGGKDVTRNQGGWIHRPNDLYLRDVPADKWRITPWGWSICGGSYTGYTPNTGELTWHILNNTLSQGAGAEGASLPNADTTGFTNWTVTLGGTGTVVLKVETSYLIDVASYRRAARVTAGATPATDFAAIFQQVAGFATTQRVRVCILFRPVAGDDPGDLRYILRRTTAPVDWDQSTGAWAASAFNQVSAGVAVGGASLVQVGDHYEYWSGDITVGGTGAQTLLLAVGYPATADASFDIFAADIVSTGSAAGAGAPVMRRDIVVTTTAAVVQAGDVVDLDNQESYRVWDASRGTWSLLFTPLWDHEDLADGQSKVVVCANHQATANDREFLCYTRTNSTTGLWRYVRTVGGVSTTASFDTTNAAGTLPRRWVPVALSIRWTSTAGEFDLSPYTQSIFVDGAKGTDAVAGGQSAQLSAGSYVALGRLTNNVAGTAPSPNIFADGIVAHLEARLFCLTDDEIARGHAQMILGNDLPTDA